jgi:hypothetical protein
LTGKPHTEEHQNEYEQAKTKVIAYIVMISYTYILCEKYSKIKLPVSLHVRAQDGDTEDADEEKEPKEMTLEEWKELQGKFRAKIRYEVRKPGEGEKKGQWKNTHMLQHRVDEEEDRQQVMSCSCEAVGGYMQGFY